MSKRINNGRNQNIAYNRNSMWNITVFLLAMVVVVLTVYQLILPAITMEQTAYCGIEPHTHDASCFEKQLVCGMEENKVHIHSEACYQEVQTLICGQ